MKFIILIFVIAWQNAGCGVLEEKVKQRAAPLVTDIEILKVRYEQNLERLNVDWVGGNDCDSLLFSGLACAGGVDISIFRASGGNGRWFRTPDHGCFPSGRSRSDISNDMFSGLFHCLYARGEKSALKEIADYAEDHNFVMGRGDEGATILKPNMQGILGRLTNRPYKIIRTPYVPGKDYVRHIQTLMISLDGEVTGYVTKQEIKMLKSYRDDTDYLIEAVTAKYGEGDFEKAIGMLLKEGKPPHYVRGKDPESYRLAHWLFTAKYVLDSAK